MGNSPNTVRDRASLRRHYEVERELADQLRAASPAERKALYRAVYNELFLRVPDHPQLVRKRDAATQQARTEWQLRLLRPWLRPDAVYLEIGAGDCHLAKAVARQVRHVYAVEVSDEISGDDQRSEDFALILSDGVSIDVPRGSVHVAYSHQLMEHLHPEDAARQLREISDALTPGGVYICTTLRRLTGPHNISRYFDTEETGFHLKEYTCGELRDLFLQAGFSSTSTVVGVKGRSFELADVLVRGSESALETLPVRLRGRLARTFPFRSAFDSVTILGRKPVPEVSAAPVAGRKAL